MTKQSPYSNHTLHALVQLTREFRAVCGSIERFECPAAISRKLRSVDKRRATLQQELAADYITNSRNRFARFFGGRAPGFIWSAVVIGGAALVGYAVAL
jgi:hypothetical protein